MPRMTTLAILAGVMLAGTVAIIALAIGILRESEAERLELAQQASPCT
jgi:hypothetical protein